jgi:hypothetical protein
MQLSGPITQQDNYLQQSVSTILKGSVVNGELGTTWKKATMTRLNILRNVI